MTVSACGPSGPIQIADQEQIAEHRLVAPIIRGADHCADPITLQPNVGFSERAQLTLMVNQTGGVRLIAEPRFERPSGGDAALCRQQIDDALATWRYRPFEQNGRPREAEITERVLLLPAERWRSDPPAFPRIDNLDSVVITLRRIPGLAWCEEAHSPAYLLQIRGNGDVTMTEQRRPTSDQPRLVDMPSRHFTIEQSGVADLVERFRDANFFALKAEYFSGVGDLPGQVLTFEAGAERASVEEFGGESVGMPLIVRDLENAVDAAVGIEPLRCGPDALLGLSPSGVD